MYLSLEPEGAVASYRLCPFSYQAGAGAGFMPTHLGRGRLPAPVLHALVAWVCVQPTCQEAWSQSELHCVSDPHALFPPAHSLLYPLPARRPVAAGLQPHTRPGTLPVTHPGLPTPGLQRAEMMGPTQNWPLLILLHGVLKCPSWKGPGSSASQPHVHTQETGP